MLIPDFVVSWAIKIQRYKYLEQLYEDLYGGLNPRKVSHQDRTALGLHELSYVYGESNFSAFYEILKTIQPREGLVFYDLGSGGGKGVIAAALLGNFSLVRGIEKLPNLHAVAEDVWKRLQSHPRFQELELPRVELINGDLYQTSFEDADIVYMCSTCYDKPLMAHLTQQMKELRPGTWVVMIENECGPEAGLKIVYAIKLAMEWGKVKVLLAQKV